MNSLVGETRPVHVSVLVYSRGSSSICEGVGIQFKGWGQGEAAQRCGSDVVSLLQMTTNASRIMGAAVRSV